MNIYNSFTPDVVTVLTQGGVGVIPTDTIYGIVASLFNQNAVEKMYDLKNRSNDKRVGTILISDITQIEDYVDGTQLLRAQLLWPAPISVELPITHGLHYAHRGNGTLAFRMPDNQALLNLINQTGPLASSSANLADAPPAVTAQEAMSTFRSGVNFYVDGGDLSGRPPSKIVRILDDGTVETLRGGK
jgi:L-threonylcarbamoyladenylate synthase